MTERKTFRTLTHSEVQLLVGEVFRRQDANPEATHTRVLAALVRDNFHASKLITSPEGTRLWDAVYGENTPSVVKEIDKGLVHLAITMAEITKNQQRILKLTLGIPPAMSVADGYLALDYTPTMELRRGDGQAAMLWPQPVLAAIEVAEKVGIKKGSVIKLNMNSRRKILAVFNKLQEASFTDPSG